MRHVKGITMNFKSYQRETVILNPQKNMERGSIPSEIRIDPLTGRSARICHFMALQWQKPDFDQMIQGTEKTCPFCPEHVLKVTPCFPDDILPEGRMIKDDMVLFPNIAPYDSLGAVATMSATHYIPMLDLSSELIKNALGLVMDFFRHVQRIGHPESVYHIVNWNYMPPSGSSLIHPHLQVFASAFAPYLMRLEIESSATYASQNQSNYWEDLVQAEISEGKRYLGKLGRTNWLMAYTPMGVAGDVLAVNEHISSTLELTDADLHDIATGLVYTIRAYEKMGIYSFNMNFFTAASGDDHFRFHLLFSPRTFFNQHLGTPDVGALRNLFNETICMAHPEEIAESIRPEFKNAA